MNNHNIPIQSWVDESLELDQDTCFRLEELAKKHNRTMNEVINHLLFNAVANRLDFEDRSDWTIDDYNESAVIYFDGEPVAKLIPIKRS